MCNAWVKSLGQRDLLVLLFFVGKEYPVDLDLVFEKTRTVIGVPYEKVNGPMI
jgi:hypothetical protein